MCADMHPDGKPLHSDLSCLASCIDPLTSSAITVTSGPVYQKPWLELEAQQQPSKRCPLGNPHNAEPREKHTLKASLRQHAMLMYKLA